MNAWLFIPQTHNQTKIDNILTVSVLSEDVHPSIHLRRFLQLLPSRYRFSYIRPNAYCAQGRITFQRGKGSTLLVNLRLHE